MPSSHRITIRLTPALEALMSDRVRQGSSVSDIVREALEAYLGVRPTARLTERPTQSTSASTSTSAVSGTMSASMSDVLSAMLSDIVSNAMSDVSASVSDVADIRERLAQLEQRVEALSASVRQSSMLSDMPGDTGTPAQPSPQLLGTYDPRAAATRKQELRRQAFTLTQIAAQLTAEGVPTRYGLPWEPSSVRYVLKRYGEG